MYHFLQHIVASFTDAWIETKHGTTGRLGVLVASFTDAWIETFVNAFLANGAISRIFYRCVDWNKSNFCITLNIKSVASFTDAWIETNRFFVSLSNPFVASFTDAWIETLCHYCAPPFSASHLLQMRGLKPANDDPNPMQLSRIFYRCVDWNSKTQRGLLCKM